MGYKDSANLEPLRQLHWWLTIGDSLAETGTSSISDQLALQNPSYREVNESANGQVATCLR